jgi:hypothetical protein
VKHVMSAVPLLSVLAAVPLTAQDITFWQSVQCGPTCREGITVRWDGSAMQIQGWSESYALRGDTYDFSNSKSPAGSGLNRAELRAAPR